jgi:hypothetical protein
MAVAPCGDLAFARRRRRRHGAASIDRKGEIGAPRHISSRLVLRLSFALGALHLVWAFPRLACGGEANATVLVHNHARVSGSILAAAEREAGRILDAAGVGIISVECPTAGAEQPCSPRLKSTDIMLRVLPPPARHSLMAEVCGFAISCNLASVYYDDAVRLAVEEEYVEFDARIILGCVIAHELGHLFLGSNSHSSGNHAIAVGTETSPAGINGHSSLHGRTGQGHRSTGTRTNEAGKEWPISCVDKIVSVALNAVTKNRRLPRDARPDIGPFQGTNFASLFSQKTPRNVQLDEASFSWGHHAT